MLPMNTRLRNPRRSLVSSPVSSAPEFSPFSLSPSLWLDAADTSTITSSSGKVSQWNDKSGNDRHVSQATATQQPTTGTRTQNGLNLIDFDGVNDRLASGSNSPNYQAITVFVAEIHDSFTPANANTARLIEVGNNLRRVIIGETTTGIPILTRAFSFFASSSATALDVQGTADSAPVGRFQILTTAWAGGLPNQNVSLRTQRLACNGGATSGTGTYTSTLNAVTHIGARAADNLRNLDGAIGELIVYSYGLSVSAIQLVEAYLMRKWAV